MQPLTLMIFNPAELEVIRRALRRERDAWLSIEPDGQRALFREHGSRAAGIAIELRQRVELALAEQTFAIDGITPWLGVDETLDRIREIEQREEPQT